MNNILIVLIISLVFFSCQENNRQPAPAIVTDSPKTIVKEPQVQKPVNDSSTLISCSGIGTIKMSDSYLIIEQKAGKENITTDSNYVEGIFQGIYHSLWKGTPKEIKVFWKNASHEKQIAVIEIENKSSVYHFANGIKIGTTLAELVKLNDNKPISFYGFGWDYGGHIVNFGNGKLQQDYSCFSGQLSIKGKIEGKFQGDKEMNSSLPGMPVENIYLSSIQIHPMK